MLAPPHNLPTQLSSFIEREREVADVQKLLASVLLVTLTGAGGCGKTCRALEVALPPDSQNRTVSAEKTLKAN